MSVFGPNQVEELIVSGLTAPAETTLATFSASADDTEVKVLSADGSAPAAGEDFKVYQKAAAAVGGLEFSDTVKADKVDSVILKPWAAEVNKEVTVTVGAANAGETYVTEVRLYNDGGTLSPENFAIISGYYVAETGDAVADIAAGLVASLQANLTRRGDNELIVTDNLDGSITIQGKPQTVVPGKIIGKQIEFEVNGKSFDEGAVVVENTGAITVAVVNENNPGAGTGKYAVNLEWFTKGYKYEVYRQTGYPADFGVKTPYYASQAKAYNSIHIKYYDDRISPTVEKQPKVLTILCEFTPGDVATNAATNAILDDLQLILGAANVPADLPVV